PVPVWQLGVGVGGRSGMEEVAKARAAVRLGVATVLSDVEADVEARLGPRHDLGAHRHGYRLVYDALPRTRARPTSHHAWVGVVADDAGSPVLRATHTGPEHGYRGDHHVIGSTNVS